MNTLVSRISIVSPGSPITRLTYRVGILGVLEYDYVAPLDLGEDVLQNKRVARKDSVSHRSGWHVNEPCED